MPRHPRAHASGPLYHVMARGNNGQKIFPQAKDYEVFLEQLRLAPFLTQYRKLLDLDPALPRCPSESAKDLLHKITGFDLSRCPCCRNGTMIVVGDLPRAFSSPIWDSS